MNKYAAAYAGTAIVMVALDMLWLGVISRPLYQQGIGHLMAERPNVGVTVLFYLRYVGIATHPLAATADHAAHAAARRPRESSRCLASRRLRVANRPCGAPSYSTGVPCLMAFAAARLDASIGTVLSSVPWMMSVGTLNEARSPRKSVLENEFRASPNTTVTRL
jgi:hypothetical protein